MRSLEVCISIVLFAGSSASAASTVSASASGSLPSASPSIVDLSDQIVLTSRETMLAFARRTGEIARLVHRPTGQEFMAPEPEPLFTIILDDPAAARAVSEADSPAKYSSTSKDRGETRIDSRSFRQVRVDSGKPGRLTLMYREHPRNDLVVTVIAEVRGDDAIHLRLSVQNGTKQAIRRIQFPRVSWTARLGVDDADDRLLIPFHDGQLISSPGRTSGTGDADYPGMASVQFTAYYDRLAGVYLAAEDGAGNPKRWQRLTAAGRRVAMNLSHLFEEAPGNDVRLDYDVVLRTFVGDWRDAAAIYKKWAVQQPWCSRKLTDRPDVPAFLKEGAGVLIDAGFNNPKFVAEAYGENLEKLPPLIESYRQKTGLAHVIFVPYGWENRGTWAGINYFPARPSDEAWKQAAQRLRENGNRLMLIPSGFWWVVKRQNVGMGPAFDDSDQIDRRKPALIKNPDGTPWTLDNYAMIKPPGQYWRGLSMHLCHGSTDAQQIMKEIFLHAARLGVSVVSFDQEQGASQWAPCYDTSHGHGRGFGRYVWEGFRKTCELILAEGKPINPELCLSIEDTCELTIPYMATYWSRQFKGGFVESVPAPGDYPNSVGLFSYLYHEYVTAIGAACVQGQGSKDTLPPAELRCFILSNNLCRGLIPGPFARNVKLDPADEWQRMVSRAYFSYCQPYARFTEYLALGETVRPPAVKCETVTIPVITAAASQPTTRPAKGPDPAVRVPAVNAGSFRAADGSVATVLANTTDRNQSAGVVFPSRPAALTLYDAHRKPVHEWAGNAIAEQTLVELEPFGTRVLIAK